MSGIRLNIFDIVVLFLQVDVILGEPFFTSGLFPWHNLYFWYAAVSAAKINRRGVKIVPQGATLKAMAGQAFKEKLAGLMWYHRHLKRVERTSVNLHVPCCKQISRKHHHL